ncbi:MAG: Ig-like domain-containing protein [Muribaculaceae bacterium]|nr:Ig-like domain-containing protein [Muribaculaceae bacterium]
MKKFAWMLALALPVAATFTSCGDDDDQKSITLNASTASVNYENTVELKASEKNAVWSSSDEFIATVNDKGVVTGHHVGEAIITASKDGASASCKLTVTETNHDYVLPLMTWNASYTAVKNAVNNLVLDTESSKENELLVYGTGSVDGFPWYIYNFETNGLASSSLTVEFTDVDSYTDVCDYLDQYFKQISFNEDTLVASYANANSVADAKIIAEVSADFENSIVTASFVPNNGTRSTVNDFRAIFDTHKAIAAQKANK